MATVYILHSKIRDCYYTGSCNDFEKRIEMHYKKSFGFSFTSSQDDWEIFLEISSLSYLQARSVEKHIKSMKSKIYIENLKHYPEMKNNLVQRFQEK